MGRYGAVGTLKLERPETDFAPAEVAEKRETARGRATSREGAEAGG